ncbi:MAG: long-chain fatty acid--CoA ligase [Dermatophilaceae bacterium]
MLDLGVGSWPTRRIRMTPDKVALVDRGVETTYAALAQQTNRLAQGLRALGVARGQRVAYLGYNATTFVETMFATAKLGAVFLPLNTRLVPPEWGYILRDSGASVLVWDDPFGEVVLATMDDLGTRPVEDPTNGPQLPTLVSVTGAPGQTSLEQVRAMGSDDPLDEPIGLEDLFMIQYTSGTTGHPKGVMLSHGNITWNMTNGLIDMDLSSDEVALVVGPLFHTAAMNQQFMPTFVKGGTLYLEQSWNVDRAFDLIESVGITFFWGPPTMFLNLMQHDRWDSADLSSLRTFQCGGAPLPEAMLAAFGDKGFGILQGYGLTEASPGVTLLRARDSMRKIGSAGTSCFFEDVRVVDEVGAAVAAGETGEIQAQGFNITQGYWRKPAATAAAILPGGWLRTGDIARIDEDGYLYIVDRLKDMIISGGENIYPAEVEAEIYTHPAVAEVGVIGVPDERWGEVGRAVVVLRPGRTATSAEIVEHLQGRLARYKIPKTVVFADELPKNASGKLLKTVMREQHGQI